jgi:parvulin-like peptidyl-prolyl isomerase
MDLLRRANQLAGRKFRAFCAALLGFCALSQVAFAQNAYPPPSNSGANVEPQRRQAEQLWYGGERAYVPPQSGIVSGAAVPPAAPFQPPARPPAGMEAPGGYAPYYGPAALPAVQPFPPQPYASGFPPPPAPASPYVPPPGGVPNWTRPDTPRTANLPAAPAMQPNIGIPPATPRQDSFAPQGAFTSPPQSSFGQQPAQPRVHGELFEAGEVVAVVGDEPILAGDMMGPVNQWLEANKDKIPPARQEAFRRRLMEQALEGEIQNKLLYLDFHRRLKAKGVGPEKMTEIQNRIFDAFDEKRLPQMMEKAKVSSPAELDAKMREQGTSLLKHKRQFAQMVMGQEGLKDSGQINHDPVITHAQMLDYYYAHIEEYQFPAKAKWEHLMARFDKFPDKATAYEAMRAMGTEVYLGGAPLWAVAKRSSHGVTADNGGQFDSTTQGSLKSKVLDEAIFALPLNQLSPILEDEEGFHIVRVLERSEAGRTSFETAQSEIKEKLKKEDVEKQTAAYLADLRQRTPVWTIFDEEKKQREQEANRTAPFSGPTR